MDDVSMTREDRVRRMQIGVIRSMNADEISPGDSDDYLLVLYSNARPLAEALVDVIEATPRD